MKFLAIFFLEREFLSIGFRDKSFHEKKFSFKEKRRQLSEFAPSNKNESQLLGKAFSAQLVSETIHTPRKFKTQPNKTYSMRPHNYSCKTG